MDYISFLSDRTVLSSQSNNLFPVRSTGHAKFDSIWRYLLNVGDAILKHFKPTDFYRIPGGTAYKIGEGATFRVDRAVLGHGGVDSKAVAIKYLKTSGLDLEREDFDFGTVLKEIRILVHEPIRQSNFVTSLLGYGCESHAGRLSLYLVAEFAPFGTLKDFLVSEDTSLTLSVKAQLCCDVARGLEIVHASRIAHGDVKLENTLVFTTEQGGYISKLSDFGHALTSGDTTYLGTRILNAPEVRCRDTPEPTSIESHQKCDVFSYGIIVWEVIQNGVRFYDTAGKKETIKSLSSLPKDELYRRALHACSMAAVDRVASKIVLQKVLGATLRDEPQNRQRFPEILEIFESESSFKRTQPKPEPTGTGLVSPDYSLTRLLPSDQYLSLNEISETNIFYGSAGRIPTEMEENIFLQMKESLTTALDPAILATTNMDISDAIFKGFGTDTDILAMLYHLKEAATLGHPKAIATCARLHYALGHPLELGPASNSPYAKLEIELQELSDEAYFPNRIRKHEVLQQETVKDYGFELHFKNGDPATGLSFQSLGTIIDLIRSDVRDMSQTTVISDHLQKGEWGSLLHCACRLGLDEIVQLLLETGVNVNNRGPGRNTPLISASMGGHASTVELLLDRGANSKLYNKLKMNPLHWLIMFDDAVVHEIAVRLVNGGADLHQIADQVVFENHGNLSLTASPLHFAVLSRNSKVVDVLLEIDPKPGIACSLWAPATPMFCAVFHYYPELIRRLVKGPISDEDKMLLVLGLNFMPSSLRLIIHGKHGRKALESTVDELMKIECNLNYPEGPQTPLLAAIRNGSFDLDIDIIEVLVSRGARTSTDHWDLTDAIHKRRDNKMKPIVKYLLDHGLVHDKIQLLYTSIGRGTQAIIEAILECGIDVNTVSLDWRISPLQFAASVAGNSSILNLLLDQGANINYTYDAGNHVPPEELPHSYNLNDNLSTVLESIPSNLPAKQLQAIKSLYSESFSALDVSPGGISALGICVGIPLGDGDIIDVLINRGSDIVGEQWTILHDASRTTNQVNGCHVSYHLLRHEAVRELLSMERDGLTPLGSACLMGNFEAALCFIEAGGNIGDFYGTDLVTLLKLSARQPAFNPEWKERTMDLETFRLTTEKILGILLDQSIPGHGNTPLHFAASFGNYPRVVELVRLGADLFAKNGEGETPLECLQAAEVFHNDELGISSDDFTKERAQVVDFLKEKMYLNTPISRPFDTFMIEYESDEQLRSRYENNVREYGEECGLDDHKTLKAMIDLANIMSTLGHGADAEKLACQVLEKREALLPKGHHDIFETRSNLLSILLDQDKINEAETLSQETIRLTNTTCLDVHPVDRIIANLDMSQVRARQKKFTQALVAQDFGIRKLEELQPSTHFTVLNARLGNAVTYTLMGDYEAVREIVLKIVPSLPNLISPDKDDYLGFYQSVLGFARMLEGVSHVTAAGQIFSTLYNHSMKYHGPKSGFTLEAQLALVNNLIAQGKCEEACDLLLRRIETLRDTIGDANIETLRLMLRLAHDYECDDRWMEAAILEGQVIEALEATLGPNHSETLEAKGKLSWNWCKQSQYIVAEILAREVLAGCRSTLGSDDPITLNAEAELALVLECDRRFEEALKIRKEILERNKEKNGITHSSTVEAMHRLAMAYILRGEFDDAHYLYQSALEININTLGEEHITTIESMVGLATTYDNRDQLKEACEIGEKALLLKRTLLGSDSQSVTETMQMLTCFYLKLGRLDEAALLQKEVYQTRKAKFGTTDPTTLDASCLLGQVYRDQGSYAEAEMVLLEALDGNEKTFGELHPDSLLAMYLVANVYFIQDRWPEAQKWGENLLPKSTKILGADAETTLNTQELLAVVYTEQHMFSQGNIMLRKLLKQIKKGPVEDDTYQLDITLRLAFSCQQLRHYEEAEDLCTTVYESRKESLGPEDLTVIEAAEHLVSILIDRSKYSEAEVLAAEIVAYYEKTDSADEEKVLDARSTLSTVYYKQGQLAKAEAMDLQVLDVKTKKLGESHPSTLSAMTDIAETYFLQERFEEAEMLQAKVVEAYRNDPTLAGDDEKGDMLVAMANLVDTYEKQKRWDEAEKLAAEVVEGRENLSKVMGDEDLIEAWRVLRRIYIARGNKTAAAQVLRAIRGEVSQAKKQKTAHEINVLLETRGSDMLDELSGLYQREVDIDDYLEDLGEADENGKTGDEPTSEKLLKTYMGLVKENLGK